MRLYIKLFGLILLTAVVQKYGFAGDSFGQVWFGLRCSLAYAIDDKPMIERLVTEAHDYRYCDRRIINAAGARR